MMVKSTQDPINFYKFYGVIPAKEVKDNYVTTCPFLDCQKSNHFYFHMTNGLYNCKKCNRSGNYFSFITQWHEHLIKFTETEHYKFLETERSIPSDVFNVAKWVYHPENGKWYVPYWGDKFLLNLGAFDPNNYNPKNRFRIFKSPGMDLQLYSIFQGKTLDSDVLLTEGEWDALALYAAFRAQRKEAPTIRALPGSTTWKEDWIPRFKNKNLTFFFDNDKGGQDGIDLLHKRSKGLRYSIASWSSSALSKLKLTNKKKSSDLKDVRDIWQYAKTKTDVLAVLLDMMASTEDESYDDPTDESDVEEAVKHGFETTIEEIEPITSYSLFQKRVKESLYTNSSILKSIDIVLASCLSVFLPGEPIWLFLVGPASCGKTTLIEAFGGKNEYFDYVSKLTATSLISGWRTDDGSDASNLNKYNLKTLFIKDLTVLLGMPDGVQQQLWDLLRDIYDGYVKITFGNGKVFEATGFKMNMIAGVTPIIHKHNDASKGERFLKLDYLGTDFDEDEHMNQAWDNQDKRKENKMKLMHTMLGFYKHLHDTFEPDNLPKIPDNIKRKVQALAKLVARLQTEVVKDRNEGMIYRPVSAVATRLQLQFKNLIGPLAFIRGEKVVTEETYSRICKLGFDSCPELNFEVIEYINKHPGCTRKSMMDSLRLPSTRLHQIISDLEQLNIIIHSSKDNGNGSGRNSHTYTLSDDIKDCLTDAKINNRNTKRVTTKSKSSGKRTPNKATKPNVRRSKARGN